MDEEEWKVIAEFPDYEVSSLGNIRSNKRNKCKLLAQALTSDRYKFVGLVNSNGMFNRRTARLVCIAFHGDPPFEGALALHKNDDKDNNSKDNVYWGTHQENSTDCERNQATKKALGGRSNRTVLTWDKTREIRKLAGLNYSKLSLGKLFGVSATAIDNIVKNKTWKESINA